MEEMLANLSIALDYLDLSISQLGKIGKHTELLTELQLERAALVKTLSDLEDTTL